MPLHVKQLERALDQRLEEIAVLQRALLIVNGAPVGKRRKAAATGNTPHRNNGSYAKTVLFVKSRGANGATSGEIAEHFGWVHRDVYNAVYYCLHKGLLKRKGERVYAAAQKN